MKIFPNVCDHKRRSFLKLSGLLGLGAATTALVPVEKMESLLLKKNMYKVSKTHTAMGTFVNMTVVHSSRDEAENALGLAFAEVDRLVTLLTRYGNQSPICELNAENSLDHPVPEIREVIGRSLYFHRDTNGAFDITVKPLVDLFQEQFAAGRQPTETEIDATIGRIGSERLRFANNSILLPAKGMGITLDGVAPGFIADRAAQVLLDNGITDHLVDAGGEIRVNGSPAKDKAWTVAIQDPSKHKEFPSVFSLMQGAVATSGNYEVYYDREKGFSSYRQRQDRTLTAAVDQRHGYGPHCHGCRYSVDRRLRHGAGSWNAIHQFSARL